MVHDTEHTANTQLRSAGQQTPLGPAAGRAAPVSQGSFKAVSDVIRKEFT